MPFLYIITILVAMFFGGFLENKSASMSIPRECIKESMYKFQNGTIISCEVISIETNGIIGEVKKEK